MHSKRIPRRYHARFPCRLRAVVRAPRRDAELAAEVLDIGMGGALIRTEAALGTGPIRLEIYFRGETAEARAAHFRKRERGPGGEAGHFYGVVFRPDRGGGLRALVDSVWSSRDGGPGLRSPYWK